MDETWLSDKRYLASLLHFQAGKPGGLESIVFTKEKRDIGYDVKGTSNVASIDLLTCQVLL